VPQPISKTTWSYHFHRPHELTKQNSKAISYTGKHLPKTYTLLADRGCRPVPAATNRVPIRYNSGFPGHCFRMLGTRMAAPLIYKKNRSRPKFVTIQNSQRITHATVIDHQTHLHTSADSLQCRSRRCSSSTSISGTTNAVIHSRPSSITSSTSCTMFKLGNLRCHAPI